MCDFEFDPERTVKKFNPYSMNGGSIMAIAGCDFAVLGADSRLSLDYSIINRKQDKIFKLSEHSFLGITGCWADVLNFTKVVQVRMVMYKQDHDREMSTGALAQMLATLLYYKRFFPYYVINILAGLDEEGRGVVYSYDPVGHCEKTMFKAGGTAGPLLQPLLDNQIGMNNMLLIDREPLTVKRAVSLIKDGFISAAERDVYTGDSVQILTISKNGTRQEIFPLRKD